MITHKGYLVSEFSSGAMMDRPGNLSVCVSGVPLLPSHSAFAGLYNWEVCIVLVLLFYN